jgi:hypothetical protein
VSPNRVRQSWSPEAYALARQARSLNFLKIEPLIQKLQQASGRSRRDCLVRAGTDQRKSQVVGEEADRIQEDPLLSEGKTNNHLIHELEVYLYLPACLE